MNKTVVTVVLLLLLIAGLGVAFTRSGDSEQIEAGIIAMDANSLFDTQEVAGADAAAHSTSSVPPPVAESVPQTTAVTQDMRGYENREFHFGLLFPKNLKATEYKEQGGALSVTFQDPDSKEGFQVYVTPYAKDTIDTARFKLDQPSGVFKEPKDVIIAGARGTMFFGYNPIMGDTREVWFIRNGFLYEVATYKQLDTWLGGIMQTWKFL